MTCDHCGKTGHTIGYCFKLHPEMCYCIECHLIGHLKGDERCPKYKEEKANIKKAESVSLTDEELKKIASYIRSASVSAVPDEPVPAAPKSYRQAVLPPRINLSGRG